MEGEGFYIIFYDQKKYVKAILPSCIRVYSQNSQSQSSHKQSYNDWSTIWVISGFIA